MEGLGRAAGSGVPFKWEGETLILDAMTIGDFGLVEQHVLAKKPDPIELAKKHLDGLPEGLQEKLLKEAYQDARKGNMASTEEVAEFLDSIEGLAFTIWLKLDGRYPGRFTLDKIFDVMAVMDEETLDGLERLRDQASGLDERGNSTGQIKTGRKKRARKARTGAKSSAT